LTEITLIVFPPEPPVAMTDGPERRTAGKGAPGFGAAERTLAGEHRSGISDHRRAVEREHDLVVLAGELRVGFAALSRPEREEWGFQRGKKP
jgi:hypothetical protein